MTVVAEKKAALRAREFHFPLAVEWLDGRRVEALVEGKPVIEVAPPPVFRGTDPRAWSPEDFLVAASASCLAITFTGLAAREQVDYSRLRVDADGVAGGREDGRFGFTRVRLRLTVEGEDVGTLVRLAEKAEETCLVSASLDVPVEVEIDARKACA
jgi:organic hydroperoxide reductase OsmC/OhrA